MSNQPSKLVIEQRIGNRIFEYLNGVIEYEVKPDAWNLNELVNDWEFNVSDTFTPSDYPYPAFTDSENKAMSNVHAAWLIFANATPQTITDEALARSLPEWKFFLTACSFAVEVFSQRGYLDENSEIG
ncbi:hypothetical protein KSF73_16070 [Burkholderiaceae bacterium DAT-1]|nr:hypothetical protein [Burkholderiaceae bacterium DAT-1]